MGVEDDVGKILKVTETVGDALASTPDIVKDVSGMAENVLSKVPQALKNVEWTVENLSEKGFLKLSADGNSLITELQSFLGNLQSSAGKVLSVLQIDSGPLAVLGKAHDLIPNVHNGLIAGISHFTDVVDISDGPSGVLAKVEEAATHLKTLIPGSVTPMLSGTQVAVMALVGIANFLRMCADAIDWAVASVPLTVTFDADAGGAAGAFAAAGFGIGAVNVANLVLQPISAVLNLIANILSDVVTVITAG